MSMDGELRAESGWGGKHKIARYGVWGGALNSGNLSDSATYGGVIDRRPRGGEVRHQSTQILQRCVSG